MKSIEVGKDFGEANLLAWMELGCVSVGRAEGLHACLFNSLGKQGGFSDDAVSGSAKAKEGSKIYQLWLGVTCNSRKG